VAVSAVAALVVTAACGSPKPGIPILGFKPGHKALEGNRSVRGCGDGAWDRYGPYDYVEELGQAGVIWPSDPTPLGGRTEEFKGWPPTVIGLRDFRQFTWRH
jgi:hypothetical protein